MYSGELETGSLTSYISESHESLEKDQVYLSVHVSGIQSPFVGMAFFSSSEDIIYIAGFSDSPELDTLTKVKQILAPAIITTCSKPNDSLFNMLLENQIRPDTPFNVTSMKRSEFSFDSAKTKLRCIQIEELLGTEESETEQMLKLASVVDFEQREVIQALGGLLSFLFKSRVIQQLEAAGEMVKIKAIRWFRLDEMMHCSKDTLLKLAVISKESHPGDTGRVKEGLSIFGILNHTRSAPGKRLLQQWVKSPLKNTAQIRERLDHVEFFVQERNNDILNEVSGLLSGMKDMGSILGRIYNAVAKLFDWKSLLSNIERVVACYSLVCQVKSLECVGPLRDLKRDWDSHIPSLQGMVHAVIDMDESSKRNCIYIRKGISKELDTLRLSYDNLPDFLSTVGDQDVKRGLVHSSIKSFEIVYLPQLGFLFSVPFAAKKKIDTEAANLEFQFESDDSVFYKTERVRELDESIGDIKGIINDMESSIVRELEINVLEHANVLRKAASCLYHLDCIVSLALAAKEFGFVRPQVVETEGICIEGGFHPLQRLCVDSFITNDTRRNVHRKVSVITGPNGSGKSIYLKQVGLIVHLAHMGSFVPAESATIGLVDGIFCRFDRNQSSTLQLSTFASDCCEIAFILNNCSSKSLVLLDEFGKGTKLEDGIALQAGLLRYFYSLNEKSPYLLMTTHFHELFSLSLIREISNTIQFRQMTYMQETNTESDVVFLYKLSDGVCPSSHGSHCAKSAGVTDTILSRMNYISNQLLHKQDIPPLSHLMDTVQLKKLRSILLELS